MKRRNFIQTSLASTITTILGSCLNFNQKQLELSNNSNFFQLGVASGDPLPDKVIIWTRITANLGKPQDAVKGKWVVAKDPQFQQLVSQGQFTALAENNFSVHVDVDNLEANSWYWYRFEFNNQVSPIGRTRTLPETDSDISQLKFAFVSCQNYEEGYFNAYKHLAEEKLDFVIHLGDYIYEGRGGIPRPGVVRLHEGGEAKDLESYRHRYTQYKQDVHLQQAHSQFPFICVPDDHEVDNDYANLDSADRTLKSEFKLRRTAAYQAYYENLPLRAKPHQENLQLYRKFLWGKLAKFYLLDTRQYRDDQPCSKGSYGGGQLTVDCSERHEEHRTILGLDQEKWLTQEFPDSPATWNVIAQQLMFAQLRQYRGSQEVFWSDGWSAYPQCQKRLKNWLQKYLVNNPIFISGDIHSYWVNDITLKINDGPQRTIATEFVGTSISSKGISNRIRKNLPHNSHVKYFENRFRGYVVCQVNPTKWVTEFKVVDTVKQTDSSSIRVLASFVVQEGIPGAIQLTPSSITI